MYTYIIIGHKKTDQMHAFSSKLSKWFGTLQLVYLSESVENVSMNSFYYGNNLKQIV